MPVLRFGWVILICVVGSCSPAPEDARTTPSPATASVPAEHAAPAAAAPVAPSPPEIAAAIATLCSQHFPDREVRALAMIFVLPDCPIANSYAPEYTRLSHASLEQGIPLVIAYVDPDLSDEQMQKHAQDFRIECPVFADHDQSWVRRAGATRTPEAAVFSRSGELLYRGRIDDRYVGVGKRRSEATTHDLRDAIEAIAMERPVPNPRTDAIGCHIPELSNQE